MKITCFFILCLMILKTVTYGQTKKDTIHDFDRHLTNELCTVKIKDGKIFTLVSTQTDTDKLKRINNYFIKTQRNVNKNELNELLCVLTEESSFEKDGLYKSCAFEPDVYIELNTAHDRKIRIVISVSCEQVAIVSADFKKIVSFGDFSEKGFGLIKHYFDM